PPATRSLMPSVTAVRVMIGGSSSVISWTWWRTSRAPSGSGRLSLAPAARTPASAAAAVASGATGSSDADPAALEPAGAGPAAESSDAGPAVSEDGETEASPGAPASADPSEARVSAGVVGIFRQ